MSAALRRRYGRATAGVDYAPETDRHGRALHPGDRVRFKTYPRGTHEGTIVVSPRVRVVMPGGGTLPALAIESGGTIYSLVSRGTTKLGGA